MGVFNPIARWLYRLICRLKIPLPGCRQVERDLWQLYPGKDREQLICDYYVKKIAMALLICALGIFLGVLLGIRGELDKVLKEGVVIRGSVQDGPVELELSTELESGEKGYFSVTVEPCLLTKEEAELLYKAFVQKLPELILGENTSLQSVCKDLVLEERYEKFPFVVEWSSSRPDILTGGGMVLSAEKAEEVILKATITYEGMKWQTELPIGIVQESLPPKEQELKALTELLRSSEASGRENAEWYLPETYQGRTLIWEQKQESSSRTFVAGAIVVAILVFFLGDKDLHDELEKKRKLMNQAYPNVVQKLALYLGAGLTVRSAFQKMAAETEGDKTVSDSNRMIAEEIGYTCREILSGVSESIAYEHMAKRIGTKEYLRLSTLLVQNLKKGNGILLKCLREEADKATLEQLQNCRKLGEEASTKLLVPMVLFLVVVMVMIMLPAFSAMGA